jgi:hypothetical protein
LIHPDPSGNPERIEEGALLKGNEKSIENFSFKFSVAQC